MTEKIAPAISPVERELVLVVDYVPNQALSVRIPRRRNFAADISDAKIIPIDPKVEHTQRGQMSTSFNSGILTHIAHHFNHHKLR